MIYDILNIAIIIASVIITSKLCLWLDKAICKKIGGQS